MSNEDAAAYAGADANRALQENKTLRARIDVLEKNFNSLVLNLTMVHAWLPPLKIDPLAEPERSSTTAEDIAIAICEGLYNHECN